MPCYYSEFGEDKWIDEHLHLPRHGFYVDIGCAHSTQFSNTAFLRDKLWEGIAVDANPAYGVYWKTPFIPAVISDKPEAEFVFHKNSLASRLADGGTVPNDASVERVKPRTIQSILDEYSIEKIDFMSIDIEGDEYNCMTTFDIARHKPSIIVAEYNTAGLGEDNRLREYLDGTRLYKVVHQTIANHIYALA